MRKFFRIAGFSTLVLVLIAAALALWAYRASQQVPDFYEQALQIDPAAEAQAGYELEREILDLRNESREPGRWEANFADEQINGWLAVDLVKKFPGVLPGEVSDPRVAIEPEQVQVACRYKSKRVSSVLSLAVEVYLTDEPNVVALRIKRARAGALPLPLKKVLDSLSQAARKAQLQLRWVQKDGDPVALVTIPDRYEEIEGRLQVDSLQLDQGNMRISGQTE